MTEALDKPPLLVSFKMDEAMSVIRHAIRADGRLVELRPPVESEGFFEFEAPANVVLRFDLEPPSLVLESDGTYTGKMPEGVCAIAKPIQWNTESLEFPHMLNALLEMGREEEGIQCGFAFHVNAGDMLDVLRTHHRFLVFEISHRFIRYYGVNGFDLDCLQLR